MNGEQQRPLLLKDEQSIWSTDPRPSNTGKRNRSDEFPKFQMQFDTDQTKLVLKRDIAWSLCSVLNDDDLPLLGSWSFFKKLVSNVKYEAVVQEYLPANPRPPDYPTCKDHLDLLLEVIDGVAILFIYVDSDELVYS